MRFPVIMKYVSLFGVSFILTILILSTSLPYQAVAQKGGPDFIPGRYIVVLEDGVSPQDVTRGHGFVPDFVYSHALNGFSGPISPVVLEKLKQDSRVLHIEQDQKMYASVQTLPTGIDRIDAEPESSPSSYAGQVTVAIIDTGIDFDHPDLNVVHRADCAKKGPFNSQCDANQGDDGHGHGTHVAGTVAALDNNIGPVGVVPDADLWAIKVLSDNGSGYNSWVIAGVDYVTANANSIDVANMSLGGGYSQALNDAVAKSIAAGVVYTVAAGNEIDNADKYSPASAPNAITVSAMADFDGIKGGLNDQTVVFSSCTEDKDDSFACFSNYGDVVDIMAPGVSIYSTYRDGGYATFSGTSMASPHVAGAAAKLISESDTWVPSEILSKLLANAIKSNNLDYLVIDDDPDIVSEPLLYVGNSITPVVDTISPIPVIATSETNPTNANPVLFTIDFGEAIDTNTFDENDITASGLVQSLINTGDDQNWTFNVASPNDLSTLSVSIGANLLKDTSGNLNFASNILDIDIDRTASAAPSIDPPSSPTTDSTPTITGTGIDGETITLTSDLDGVVGTTTVLGDNTWSLTTFTLQAGSHSLTATQTDLAGNTSPQSSSVGLEVEALPGVTVGSISPNEGSKGTPVDVTITGSGFVTGAEVTLANGSGPTPSVTVELVSGDGITITATITIPNGGPPRSTSWDVTVTNPDSSNDTLINGFTVNP